MELVDKNDDRFAERLRGIGPLGTLAVVVIFAANFELCLPLVCTIRS